MANVYATKSGLWSDTTVWNTGALPASVDVVYSNTFTITANSSTKVDTIRNSTLAPNILSGGSFVLANGVSLSANVVGGNGSFTSTVTFSSESPASATIVGNCTGGSNTNSLAASNSSSGSFFVLGNAKGGTGTNSIGAVNLASGTLNITGNVTTGTNGAGATNASTSTGLLVINGNVTGGGGANIYGASLNGSSSSMTVNGNIVGGTNATGYGIYHNSSGTVTVNGNVTAATGNGINNNTTGAVVVSGAVIAATVAAINNASTGTVVISGGPITASSLANAFTSPNTSAVNRIYTSIINAPNGRQAIYAPRYQVFPSASATYTRQAVNGYDSYADYWTSNATFSYPASSDVVLSTVYSNNTLSGSMALPPTSAVALGASVGTTAGTASITLEGLLNQSVATLNTSNSIGARLKNVATTQALSAVANSLNFNN